MFLIPRTYSTTWIIWIMLNLLYPTYLFGFILTMIMPNIAAIFWGLAFLLTAPPLGLVFLIHVVIYGFIFWIISLGCSFLIDKLPYFYLRIFVLIILFLILLKPTFSPIYGLRSAFGEGNSPGKTLWQWYKIID